MPYIFRPVRSYASYYADIPKPDIKAFWGISIAAVLVCSMIAGMLWMAAQEPVDTNRAWCQNLHTSISLEISRTTGNYKPIPSNVEYISWGADKPAGFRWCEFSYEPGMALWLGSDSVLNYYCWNETSPQDCHNDIVKTAP